MGCRVSKKKVSVKANVNVEKNGASQRHAEKSRRDGAKVQKIESNKVSHYDFQEFTNLYREGRSTIKMCRIRSVSLLDNYELTNRVLGTGISGAVKVACDKVSGREFALKTLKLSGIGQKKQAMLRNEVSIFLQLDHPNIAKLVEVYEEQEAVHLVMELCNGGELYDRLAQRKAYSEEDTIAVTRQMLKAINYCHKHKVCHRDLKLENWVYESDGDDCMIKLIDFGFSRVFNPGIPMTAMHGTVYYVSPEVMDGCYKEKCDIWSIGVIVYMLLSGSPPFSGAHDHEILIKVKRALYSFEGPRWLHVSEEAKNFVSHLLVKDPDRRPSAEIALLHPWLVKSEEQPTFNGTILQQMKLYASSSHLKRAALLMIALSMSSRDVMSLHRQFEFFDHNKSGTIYFHELVSVLVSELRISEVEARRIFSKVDESGDSEIHYSEFLASTINLQEIHENLIREVFRKFNFSGTGHITAGDLRQVMGSFYSGVSVDNIFEDCALEGNNYIDYDVFREQIIKEDDTARTHRSASKPLNHTSEIHFARSLTVS